MLKCVVCGKKLVGTQTRYCCDAHRRKALNEKHNPKNNIRIIPWFKDKILDPFDTNNFKHSGLPGTHAQNTPLI